MTSGLEFLKGLATVKSKAPALTLGLDIGTAEIKAVVLGRRASLKKGPAILGQHREAFTAEQEPQASEAIKRTVAALNVPVKEANVAVSGQWVIMRVVEMPKLAPAELHQALPFEAQRYVPFNLQEVLLDGVILGPAEANKVWVLFVVCKRELLERRIHWIKQAGLEPALIDVDAIAVANAFANHADGKAVKGTHALMNIGAQWTNLVLLKDGTPFLVRDVPWGAGKLYRTVASQLAIQESAVMAQLKDPTNAAPQFLEAVKVAAEALAVELQLSFDFFESRFGPPPEQVLVSGGVSQAPVFLEALKQHVTQPLTAWSPAESLSSQFVVAYGLALRGA